MVKDADIVPDMTWCKFVTNYIAVVSEETT